MATDPTSQPKTVIVTGVSRGIGRHLATSFLDAGFAVIGIGRSDTDVEHANFRYLRADIGSLADIEAIRDQIPVDSISGLINNAGMHGPIGPFEDTDVQEWIDTWNVNLFGAAALTQLCIPGLRANKGFLIFLSGGGSGFAKPNFTAYGVSKTAVVRFAENLAIELAPDVLVYTVAPGPNRTAMLDRAIKAGDGTREEEIVGFEEPERLCLFLANNRDARYSGRFIHVRDDYQHWGDPEFADDMYKLRRIK